MTDLHGRISVVALLWLLALFSAPAQALCEEPMSGSMQMSSSQNCQPLPPPTPGQAGTPMITASPTTSSDYTVNWQAASFMIVGTVGSYGYQLLEYRDGALLRTVQRPASSTSFAITGASAGVYTYKVRGCNSDSQYTMVVCGPYSALSAGHSVVAAPSLPSVPASVWLPSTDNDGVVTLSWQASSGTVTAYSYAQSPTFTPWVSAAQATSVQLSGLSDGSFSYRVRACNSVGCSGYASSNTLTVSHPTPSMPGSISVPSEVAESSYTISWLASTSSAADSYQIAQYHSLSGWSSWQVVSGLSALVTVDESGDWRHRVRACNQLPDMSYKCSSARESSLVDVQLPAPWAMIDGEVADQWFGHLEGLQSDETVGAVEGHGGVSGGAATYQIPIVLPPGRAGMQPSVQLSYSSRAGQGIAGVGWQLNAGSGIARCSATVAQDGYQRAVTLSSSDKLCLDGQRLMVVSGGVWPGGCGVPTRA